MALEIQLRNLAKMDFELELATSYERVSKIRVGRSWCPTHLSKPRYVSPRQSISRQLFYAIRRNLEGWIKKWYLIRRHRLELDLQRTWVTEEYQR
jgi:hypothetical protein